MGYPSSLALLESRSCLGHLDPEQDCTQAGTATAPEREREVCVCPSLTRRPQSNTWARVHKQRAALSPCQRISCTLSYPTLFPAGSHWFPAFLF